MLIWCGTTNSDLPHQPEQPDHQPRGLPGHLPTLQLPSLARLAAHAWSGLTTAAGRQQTADQTAPAINYSHTTLWQARRNTIVTTQIHQPEKILKNLVVFYWSECWPCDVAVAFSPPSWTGGHHPELTCPATWSPLRPPPRRYICSSSRATSGTWLYLV